MRITTSVLQNNFGKYLKYAKDGLEITVTKNGHDIAKLVGIDEDYIIAESSYDYKIDKVSYDDFIKLDREKVSYELIDGYIFNAASPNAEHQNIVLELGVLLKTFFKDKPCMPFISPFDVILDRGRGEKNVVQPDLLVICDTHMFDENKRYKGVPALVIEVLSPGSKSYDMVLKLDLYKDSGIKEYWIVSPEEKLILVYKFSEKDIESFKVFGEKDTLVSYEFPELEVQVNDLLNKLYLSNG